MSENYPKYEELQHILAMAESIARETGEIVREHFARGTTATAKDDRGDIQTEADRAAESFIKIQITRQFPDHAMISEEGTALTGTSDYQWIVDPLDGTYRFWHRLPEFGVSLGVTYRGQPVVGVIWLTQGFSGQEEMYSATRGYGAYCNGSPVRVSTINRLDRALLGYDYGHDAIEREKLPLLRMITPHVQYVLMGACATYALCALASGRTEGYAHRTLAAWDFAAALVIIEEAGGKVTDLAGHPVDLHAGSTRTYEFLASNGALHDQLLKLVK